jgi:hypothetical protein
LPQDHFIRVGVTGCGKQQKKDRFDQSLFLAATQNRGTFVTIFLAVCGALPTYTSSSADSVNPLATTCPAPIKAREKALAADLPVSQWAGANGCGLILQDGELAFPRRGHGEPGTLVSSAPTHGRFRNEGTLPYPAPAQGTGFRPTCPIPLIPTMPC